MAPVRISVIIATWNAAGVLERCLETLEAQQVRGGFETIVVDNGSTDHTSEVLARHRNGVRVITNAHNEGFSAANNRGARQARGAILFFLNSDTELLGTDVLERIASTAEDPAVGIVGPMLVNPDGSVQPSCAAHPSIGRALLVASGLHRLLPDALRARVEPARWSHTRPVDTGWVMGAALAMRAEVFREIGGFWSATTMFAEDEEIAFRAQRHGYRVRFDNAARVLHHGNQSNAQRWSDAVRAERVAAAELTFLREHYSRPRAAVIRAIVGGGYALRAIAHRALGRRGRAQVFGGMARVYRSGARTS